MAILPDCQLSWLSRVTTLKLKVVTQSNHVISKVVTLKALGVHEGNTSTSLVVTIMINK